MPPRSRTARTTGIDSLRVPLALLGVLSVFVAGCGSAAGPSKGAAAPASTSSGASGLSSRSGVTVKVMRTDYGNVLVDGNGRALYLFTRDRTQQSQCYGACAVNWPPALTAGRPIADTPAQASLLGTTRRRDGPTQATYGGHPLYYYIGDRHPGQVLCQDVEEFGGRWYVVTRRGSAVL